MKKIILCLCLCFVFNSTFCQDAKQPITKSDYLQKSKHQKIAAWSLLGGGIAMVITGVAIGSSQPYIGSNNNPNKGLWLVYVGAASALTSIPFFIMAHKNKRRAASLALGNQINYFPLQNTVAVKIQPAIRFKIGI